MIALKKIRIPPDWNSQGRFALCGDASETQYHVWIDKTYSPLGLDNEPAYVYANSKNRSKRIAGRARHIGITSKLGKQLTESMISFAKNHQLLETAIEERKKLDEKQAEISKKRAETVANKKIANDLLIFIADKLVSTTPEKVDVVSLAAKARSALQRLGIP